MGCSEGGCWRFGDIFWRCFAEAGVIITQKKDRERQRGRKRANRGRERKRERERVHEGELR